MLQGNIVYPLIIIQYGNYTNNWVELVEDTDTHKRYNVPHNKLFGHERGSYWANIVNLTEVTSDEQA